jgi:thiol-disulfide isomerase/thioredoxin
MPLATLLLALLATDTTVPLGTKISNLTFKDIRYLPRSLDDFKSPKALVLVFVDRSCPVAQKYLPVLEAMHQQYASKGVQFVAVNPSPDDSIMEMAGQALDLKVTFPFVKDFGGKSAKVLGVSRVPTAVILNDQRVLIYRGRVDDAIRLGGTRPEPTRRDLQLALDEVLAGKTVTTAETVVDGCPITFLEEAVGKPVNFAEHVEPLIRKHCMECHKPGTVAPFTLTSYENVKSKASSIAEVVREERMPPWYGHPEHGTFINKRGMTDAERETILSWVKQGKPSGDLTKVPPLPAELTQVNEWLIGKPDLVLSTSVYDIPATGDVDYKYAILPYVFTEDTWVQDIQIRPDSNKLVHHANLAFFVVGQKFSMNNFLTGYVPGGIPMQLKSGTAVKIPKGSVLGLQIHFVSVGKPEKGKVRVGLKYARGELNQQVHFRLFVDNKFAIPPEAAAHPITASWKAPDDIVGIGLFSHMHVRGRDMSFFAQKPGGEREQLLMIPNYNFDWQMAYEWAPGTKKFPKGTQFECIAHYDNSSFNAYNPNPKVTVRMGQQTHEEMMNGFFFYVKEHEKLGYQMDGATGRVKK